jgi:hypothetical protein
MLQTWFDPQLRERSLEATAILQEEHYAHPIGDKLSGLWMRI